MVSGVAGDFLDRVYLFIRTPVAEVLVFEPNGTLLTRWGSGRFVEPHMLFISARDEVYATDISAHTVTRWTLDGRLLHTWGTPGAPGTPGSAVQQADAREPGRRWRDVRVRWLWPVSRSPLRRRWELEALLGRRGRWPRPVRAAA